MQEFVTEALVLRKEPLRDFDARYSFFTKRFGKVVGNATSARKVTSKLAGHLEPGTLARVRFIEKNHGNGTQIADALKYGTATVPLVDLGFLDRMLVDGEADEALWNECVSDRFSWATALKLFGWDPRNAVCAICGKKATAFYVPHQEFFCENCALRASKLARDALILLGHVEV